jgi:peptide/nickel transport system permease protein
MLRFVLRRTALGLRVALIVMVLAFLLTRLSGDLAISIAGPGATADDIEAIRKTYGLDRPLAIPFIDWMGRAATGDLGESIFFKQRVSNLIARRMPITVTLGVVGLVIALLVSIPLGILAAVREGSSIDRAVTLLTLLGQAMPSFWLGVILMIVLDLQLGWLPISETGTWQHFVMPGIVLAFTAIPALTRLTRSGMIDAMALGMGRAMAWWRMKVVGRRTLARHLASRCTGNSGCDRRPQAHSIARVTFNGEVEFRLARTPKVPSGAILE